MVDGGAIVLVAEHVMVTLALPDFDVSATLVAVTFTVAGDGTDDGAVYSAVFPGLGATVPTVEFPPATPFTLHVTPAAKAPVPLTFAVNTWPPPVATSTGFGETLTLILSSSVTAADPEAEESAALTAVTVTLAGDGKVIGAAYRPEGEIVPTVALPPAIPFTFQLTLVFEAPTTVA